MSLLYKFHAFGKLFVELNCYINKYYLLTHFNYFKVMKNTGGVLAALLGGAVVGAALGILLAPEKGSETRSRIVDEYESTKKKLVEILKKKGINLNKSELDDLVNDIKSEVEETIA